METWINVTLLGAYGALILLDLARPARTLPRIRWWRLRGILSLVPFLLIGTLLPLVTDEWLGAHRLFDARSLGTFGGAVLGLVSLELVAYGWHRALHRSSFLWRHFHQMHHSAERVDVFGAFYFHPLDVAGFTLAGSVGLVWLVGVTVEAAIIATGIATFLAFFQHANLRTPAWLGYVIHRPENHALHHQRGLHAHNYGSIALWDQLFGTFRNPKTWDAQAGFYDGASARIKDMLLGRDISTDAPGGSPTRETDAQETAPSAGSLA
jgi:sterol desaturase/sphingolipid hydroxylase (fatty acid hydroxylase superfamily)